MPPQPPPEQTKDFFRNWWSLQSRSVAISLPLVSIVLVLFSISTFLNAEDGGQSWANVVLLWPFWLILILCWFYFGLLFKRYGFGNPPGELQRVTRFSSIFAVIMAIVLVALFAFMLFADEETVTSVLLSGDIAQLASPVLGVLIVVIAILVLRALIKNSRKP